MIMESQAKEEVQMSEQVTDEELAEVLKEDEVPEETKVETKAVPDIVEEEKEVIPKSRKKKSKEDEDVVEERTYTIPLGKALIMPPRRRAPRAMRMIKTYIIKHMKIPNRAEEEDEEPPRLTLTNELNERVWGRGIEKPPRKIRVRATKDKEGNVTVHLAERD
jgi:large subunit ribosomal protein L31e